MRRIGAHLQLAQRGSVLDGRLGRASDARQVALCDCLGHLDHRLVLRLQLHLELRVLPLKPFQPRANISTRSLRQRPEL